MKKAWLFSILAVILILSALVFVGCEKKDNVVSISVKDFDGENPLETTIGDFVFVAHTLVVTRESGSKSEIALTEAMIDPADIFKFYQEGEHEIRVHYKKKTCTFKISVARLEFGDLRLPQNNVFTYDGKPHSVEVMGDIPANAVVTYVGGNSFVNAGEYNVTAVVTCDGYVTVRLNTTVKINRAKHDMSGVRFESAEFTYDGSMHSVAISGDIPESVPDPIYYIDEMKTAGAINAGTYTVVAKFPNSNSNYDPIPDMEATLTIKPAEFTVEGVEIVFKKSDGKTIDGNMKIYDGTAVSFDLNDYNKLSSKVSVYFSVLDSQGAPLSTSNKDTNMIFAGEYTVMVEFRLADSKNYSPIEPIVSKFEIKKAKYDMTNVHFDNDVVIYDGQAHRLYVDMPAAHPLNIDEIQYEYYLDGELVKDSEGNPATEVTEAGEYTVKAIFTVHDENYEQVAPLEAILRIEKAK